jgi:outer membrane protein TolC
MTGALLLGLLLQATPASAASADTLPVITLDQALVEATQLDPNYVAAVGQLDNAEWGRRAALLVFLTPNVTASAGYSQFSTSQFNLGIGRPASASGSFSLAASYDLFAGGRKLFGARQASAELESAQAGELGSRFLAALETERAYYAVLGARELRDVATQRLARAREQFALARARVQGGATVQSDSLQVLLEMQRAETEQLNRQATLTVARLDLGRRVGRGGPVDAAPIDGAPPGPLPLTLEGAVQLAASQGPAWRQARANERAAEAAVKVQQAAYLPTVSLVGSYSAFDNKFFPTATTRRAVGVSLSWSLWNGGQREFTIARLQTSRDIARAVREDLERRARHDVTEAYTGYDVARRTLVITTSAVAVAAEVLRVQQARYQAGASTVLELLDAQTQLVQAQADQVQARYDVRLSRAGLEAILGRRLDTDSTVSQP